ncbi:MAG: polyamine aminopropyltransferase [Deltaproteobacteria bacterium]|nr:polyamine aminopropyltransferase [Deltaproteobacteria bacterium]
MADQDSAPEDGAAAEREPSEAGGGEAQDRDAFAVEPGQVSTDDEQADEAAGTLVRGSGPILLASVFAVAACGIIYELLAGALSSYLLGGSVTWFSLVIGLFLSAMGLGSFISRFVTRRLLLVFLSAQIAIAVIGGSFALLLFSSFAVLDTYLPLLVLVLLLVGTLVGLEIPLLVRILRKQTTLRAALGNVLALDYLGALAASLLFPLLLLPALGLVRTGFLFGLLNAAVAGIGLHLFRRQMRRVRLLFGMTLLVAAFLLTGLVTAGWTTTLLEDVIYDDEILFARSTPYQRLVLTRWHDDLRLFIDGNIQFSTVDESRYHEALIHPAMGMLRDPRKVLVLGGGDGMAVREILKHDTVERVDLVDLDPEMTRLFAEVEALAELNGHSLSDHKVRVHNADAQKYLEQHAERYDLIVMDLPDPNKEALGKLYTRSFFRLAAKHLLPCGILVTQSTSPYFATEAFWCIVNTLRATTLSSAGGKLFVVPYHANVPSFGEWGFTMAALQPLATEHIRLDVPTQYLTPEMLPGLFVFPKDIGHLDTPVNRLDNQALVDLYQHGFQLFSK